MVKILIVEDDNDITNMIHDLLRLNCIESVSAYSGTEALLLLDEHTAALDPKTAQKVLSISSKLVEENHITTLMITHNMEDALRYGNKTMIMKDGEIIALIEGERRKNMTVDELIHLYSTSSQEYTDRVLLK